jgi:hypothetical protein
VKKTPEGKVKNIPVEVRGKKTPKGQMKKSLV